MTYGPIQVSAVADGSAASPERVGAGAPAVGKELLARAAALARGSRAASTWEAYERDWVRFQRWCESRGLVALPAAPSTVCVWLADQAPTWRPATADDPLEAVVEGQVQVSVGLRPATIARRLAAVSVTHQAASITDPDQSTSWQYEGRVVNPAEHPSVRAVMAGIRRHPGVAPTRRRTAARSSEVNTIVDGLDPAASAVDARDLALLHLGLSAALRRSDLARLDLEDLTASPDGLAIRVRRSKTDQEAVGAVVGIAADDGFCAAAEAVELWRAHLSRAGVTRGALWRPIHRAPSGRQTIRPVRLSGHAINQVVTRRAAQAGLEGDFGAHSLRRGFATEALAGGAAEHAVMRHGRWRSATVMRGYVDDATTFDATNPTRILGLRRPEPGASASQDEPDTP